MKIEIELSEASIKKALRQIEKYKKDVIRKTRIFAEKMGAVGMNVVSEQIETVPPEYRNGVNLPSFSCRQARGKPGVYQGRITLSGEQVLFIEFSAGILHGQTGYPLPSGDGYGMGTYPGAGHWDDPEGWWVLDETNPEAGKDGWVHTEGTPAIMPMYKADMEICSRAAEIAKEAFKL